MSFPFPLYLFVMIILLTNTGFIMHDISNDNMTSITILSAFVCGILFDGLWFWEI